jgi:import receptor subunit TOM22
MVELVEVEDESFETKQVGPEDDDYYTDTGMSTNPARNKK